MSKPKVSFESEDLILLRCLLRAGRCNLYDLHKDYRLSPAQLLAATDRLSAAGLIEVDDLDVRVRAGAERILFTLRRDLYRRPLDWKDIPPEFRSSPADLPERYLPRFRLLDRRLLKYRAKQR